MGVTDTDIGWQMRLWTGAFFWAICNSAVNGNLGRLTSLEG